MHRATGCSECHVPDPANEYGACRSAPARAWKLASPPAQLCKRCHPAIAQGFAVKHAPAVDGRCLACHDPHASDRPHVVKDDLKKLCLSCHTAARPGSAKTSVDRGAFAHAPLDGGCEGCHAGPHGGVRAKLLTSDLPDLCYRCHARKDAKKNVHAALRMNACTDCHAAHRSDVRPLLKDSAERLCAGCHDAAGLATGPYVHAAATEGSCTACHDSHSTDEPKLIRSSSSAVCLSCHDAKAPTGKGTARPQARIDRSRKRVHMALDRECKSCHDTGHSSSRPHLLRAPVVELCLRCHTRNDGGPYVHGAVLVGECEGCHDPHSSDLPRLARTAVPEATCFTCHDDELKRRRVLHAPIARGACYECHAPHSAPAPMLLTRGRGDETCKSCHRGVGEARRPHAALVRYGCTGCHDAHASQAPALLPAETNALCETCHPAEKDGSHATRSMGLRHPVSGFADPRREGRELSCVSCHDPHASDGPVLLRSGKTASESCDGCHGPGSTGKRLPIAPASGAPAPARRPPQDRAAPAR